MTAVTLRALAQDTQRTWAAAGAAFEMAGAVGGGCLLGWGVDTWLGSTPWGVLAGAFLGCVAGFLALVRLAVAGGKQ